jgi:hypothetical protein
LIPHEADPINLMILYPFTNIFIDIYQPLVVLLALIDDEPRPVPWDYCGRSKLETKLLSTSVLLLGTESIALSQV